MPQTVLFLKTVLYVSKGIKDAYGKRVQIYMSVITNCV